MDGARTANSNMHSIDEIVNTIFKIIVSTMSFFLQSLDQSELWLVGNKKLSLSQSKLCNKLG